MKPSNVPVECLPSDIESECNKFIATDPENIVVKNGIEDIGRFHDQLVAIIMSVLVIGFFQAVYIEENDADGLRMALFHFVKKLDVFIPVPKPRQGIRITEMLKTLQNLSLLDVGLDKIRNGFQQ